MNSGVNPDVKESHEDRKRTWTTDEEARGQKGQRTGNQMKGALKERGKRESNAAPKSIRV